ncbi:MAG: hypothetical protein CMF58_00465 [Lentimicrobiaceae bacterium]|jgi:hypothetical protein|nr:hypothetical protein [Lentimicrobiaceae bacterium]MDG1901517.1 hypothetical protein [Bacteroidales bacterium]
MAFINAILIIDVAIERGFVIYLYEKKMLPLLPNADVIKSMVYSPRKIRVAFSVRVGLINTDKQYVRSV